MPVISRKEQRIDYIEEGAGNTVILIHSSVSGNRQWRSLCDTLKNDYRVVAPNLFGYGATTEWPENRQQTLEDQAGLIMTLCEEAGGPVHLVGHSFGGAVALKAALMLGPRVASLILFEPMLAYLLRQNGRNDEYQEAHDLANHVITYASTGNWDRAAVIFADYWIGDGAWAEMTDKRRESFAASLRPTIHEFIAMLGETTTVSHYTDMPANTLIMHTSKARRTIREIVAILKDAFPHWSYEQIAGVGHMAPLTNPDLVNPIIKRFLAQISDRSTIISV